MLCVLEGNDSDKIKKRIAEITKGSEIVRFGEGGEPLANILSHVGSSGLFSKKLTLLLNGAFEDVNAKELILENLKSLHESETAVLVVEGSIDAGTTKKLEKYSKIELYDISYKTTEPAPNVFALADAFAKGDRKKAWVLYRQFIENGSAPEEIHGALSWQARAMVLASKTKNAEEAGLKPFAYTKAKSAAARFTPEAVENLSRGLVALYHQSRMGGGNLEDLLEVFLLGFNAPRFYRGE